MNEIKEGLGLTPSLIASGAARVDPQDQLETGFAVDTRKGSCERVAGDAVVKDFPDLEQVLGNVIEGAQDNHVVFLGCQSVIVPSASAEGQAAAGQA